MSCICHNQNELLEDIFAELVTIREHLEQLGEDIRRRDARRAQPYAWRPDVQVPIPQVQDEPLRGEPLEPSTKPQIFDTPPPKTIGRSMIYLDREGIELRRRCKTYPEETIPNPPSPASFCSCDLNCHEDGDIVGWHKGLIVNLGDLLSL